MSNEVEDHQIILAVFPNIVHLEFSGQKYLNSLLKEEASYDKF